MYFFFNFTSFFPWTFFKFSGLLWNTNLMFAIVPFLQKCNDVIFRVSLQIDKFRLYLETFGRGTLINECFTSRHGKTQSAFHIAWYVYLFIMISKCILYYFQNTILQTLYQKCVTLLWCRATFVIFFTFLPLILHYRSNDNCRRRQRWQQEWKILWNQQVASSQTCIKSFD